MTIILHSRSPLSIYDTTELHDIRISKSGELFCMKDIAISSKSDLFFYIEDWEEREKRSRGSTDFCKCYREQSDSYYTYNDYLTLWKKQCGPV